ncbi:MAG: response regulator [Alphaproteobacteria bacterium]|nr:response regulator [Alphaproteobacteria bacterium]
MRSRDKKRRAFELAASKKNRRSIRTKLALVALIGVMSAMLLAGSIAVWSAAERRYTGLKDELDGVAATMAIAVAPSLSKKAYREAQNILRAIGRMPRVDYASVVDTKGTLIAAFGDGVVLARDAALVNAGEKPSLLSALRLQTYPLEVPVIRGGEKIGTLHLIADVSELRTALAESAAAALLWGLLAATIGVVAAIRMGTSVTGPILNLTEAMRDVRARHDYAAKVPRTSHDETGDLVDAFNEMLEEIRTRDAQLARHRETLELTVAERTSDLRAATIEAQEANAAKSDFLATMSHEIRTPMNGMLVMAELLTASGMPPRLQRYADVIVTSGKSLLSIINDILDFSKIEAGKMELEAIRVEPRKLVDEVTRLFAQRAASKGLDLAGYVCPDVPEAIAADPVRLNQVLSNLVNNALKFTKTGGVSVIVRRQDAGTKAGASTLQFEVIDTGIGIAEDKIDDVFEAFSQADQTTTRKFGGTGIGLAICQRLSVAMGGNMALQSKLGEGSTFSLCAPFEVLEPGHEKHAPVNTPKAQDGPERAVVLALPPGPTRSTLSSHAAARGYSVLEVDSSSREIQNRPDQAVAVIGCGQAVEAIRADDPNIKFVNLTGLCNSQGAAPRTYTADASIVWPLASDDVAQLFNALSSGDLSTLESDAAKAIKQETFATFTGVRILAADDSAINQEVLGEALSRLKVDVTHVGDGKAALEAVQATEFDLVFMDGSMPVMDGYEATAKIREWESDTGRAAMPIIALTAHVVGSQAQLWRQAGMNDCVTKPFKLSTLESCLETWLPGRAVEAADASPRASPDEPIDSIQSAQASSNQSESAAGEPPLLDPEVMDQVREMQTDDFDLAARIVSLYRQHAPKALEVLADSWTTASDEEIAKAAHALKSLSRNIGAIRVGEICEVIESTARDDELNRDAPHVDQLQAALRATLEALPVGDAGDAGNDARDQQAAPAAINRP